jgi:hypothetical protein
VLRLAVERDDGDLTGARLHDLEVFRGDVGVRLGKQQRLVRGDLRTGDLDHLRRQAATVVERDKAAWTEQTLEPTIAHEECPLIVLDDDLELEQHNTVSDQKSSQSVTTRSSGCRLQSHVEDTEHRLSPEPPRLRAWLRPRRSGDQARRCQALRRGA